MNKLKKNDEVVVIAGKDKGKRGLILSLVSNGEYLLVEGVNVAKKHVKRNPNEKDSGGIVDKAMPIHRSNVMLYDAEKNKGSRVGIRIQNNGQRVRYLKVSDKLVTAKE